MKRRSVVRHLGVLVIAALAIGTGAAAHAAPVLMVSSESGNATAELTPNAGTANPTPLFAFYYQWFDPSSWSRAKIDYPELGRYSSDSIPVMKQQIEWAKAAGIGGFIVSWKSTPTNNRRLRLLVGVAQSENFKLAMIYQGLDFSRKPIAVARVAADFASFERDFAPDPVFYRIGGKPLTMFSGSWAYTHEQVAAITTPVRKAMVVLSTEKSVAGYRRIADVTDGDAYYWSSANPATNTNYAAKLASMSAAIHADGKYWIAPFAAGFDARLVGGTKTVSRDSGQTLRVEYAAAVASAPDVLGLISWNEFSENTYIEPSKNYGHTFVDVLSQLRNVAVPQPASTLDSSDSPPHVRSGFPWVNVVTLTVLPIGLIVGVSFVRRRVRRQEPLRPKQVVISKHAVKPGGRR